jgi:hypothetical protein
MSRSGGTLQGTGCHLEVWSSLAGANQDLERQGPTGRTRQDCAAR